MKLSSTISLRHFAALSSLTLLLSPLTPLNADDSPGGFLEDSTTTITRSLFNESEIGEFLPQRGAFTFPAPYNTRAIRLTNSSDCSGRDCVNYAGYSYWRNINAHSGRESMLIFVGLDRSRGGAGPSLFEYNKSTGELTDRGPLFDSGSPLSWYTGEGWYFSATQPHKLYINDGSRILRFDVISKDLETVMDIRSVAGDGFYMAQMHSSDDDNVHSATVKDSSNYQDLGCMVYTEDTGRYQFFESEGAFDECQVGKGGDWLVIKENVDNTHGEDNRIINLETGNERVLLDSDGAAGHSDMGHGYMVAADGWAGEANTWKLWDFADEPLSGEVVYHNLDWSVMAPAHVSHTNARDSVAPGNQYACGSSANRANSTHANEIICFGLNASDEVLVVAPTMTDLNAGGGSNYAKLPKGNLGVDGKYFFWTSNTGGDRLDAFLVEIPSHLLGGISTPTSPDGDTGGDPNTGDDGTSDDSESDSGTDDDGTSDDSGSDSGTDDDGTSDDSGSDGETAAGAVTWTDQLNVTATDDSLTKTSGCEGCADGSATSEQQISEGDASLSFTATDSDKLLYIGFTDDPAQYGSNNIDYAVRLQAGIAEVRENGDYLTDTTFSSGDRFHIRIADDEVRYSRNGSVFHTSDASPQYPLRVDTALYSLESGVADTSLTGSSQTDGTESEEKETGEEEAATLSVSPSSSVPANAALWENLVNVSANNTILRKTDGCYGCPDAGATTLQQILHGDGSMAFTAADSDHLLFAGLAHQSSQTDYNSIDYAVRLQAGYAEVRENGSYQTNVPFVSGDRFRIIVRDGRVRYAKNGNVFYTSNASPQYPLRAQTVHFSMDSAVNELTLNAESAPGISNISAEATDSGTVTVNWTTDSAAESLVQYGRSSEYGKQGEHKTSLLTDHTAVLSGLSADTLYHFRVLNRDEDGHIVSSGDLRFTTPGF